MGLSSAPPRPRTGPPACCSPSVGVARPRKLAVPGEELPKVVYRLIDPDQYVGQEVLVVGGGDSALEAAASIAEVSGTQVTLSYRGDAFGRAKPKNRERVASAADRGNLKLLLVFECQPDPR